MPADFDKQEYWHQRFTTERSFEWLAPSSVFMSILDPYLDKLTSSSYILHLGFGTSDLQNYFRKRGFPRVLNVDYEPLAVERGRELEDRVFGDVQMSYMVADATQLDLNEKFSVVVDKSTLDAVSCGGEDAILRMAQGILRCLADDGVWISLSYSSCRFDVPGLPFDVKVVAKLPTPKQKETDPDVFHYCYLLQPKDRAPCS